MEIRAKMEESRQETERILAQQAAELRAKKAEMDRRDRERLARMAREQEERAIQNAIKKKQAEERIQSEWQAGSGLLQSSQCTAIQTVTTLTAAPTLSARLCIV
jgi:hypothetical protein